jgi:hypothetical protein
MINQKQLFIPTVGVAPVTSYSATANFTTEYIEFPASQKDWSVDITTTGTVDATITVLVCNTFDGTYKNYKTASTDVDIATDPVIFDSIMPFRFMKLDYTANTTDGLISISITK